MSDDKVLTIMQMVMKSAEKVARDRPDLGLDAALQQCRQEYPEWFKEDNCDCIKCDLKRKGLWK